MSKLSLLELIAKQRADLHDLDPKRTPDGQDVPEDAMMWPQYARGVNEGMRVARLVLDQIEAALAQQAQPVEDYDDVVRSYTIPESAFATPEELAQQEPPCNNPLRSEITCADLVRDNDNLREALAQAKALYLEEIHTRTLAQQAQRCEHGEYQAHTLGRSDIGPDGGDCPGPQQAQPECNCTGRALESHIAHGSCPQEQEAISCKQQPFTHRCDKCAWMFT